MLRFKGKKWAVNAFIKYLIIRYGAKTTMKEIYERIGNTNVYLR